MSSVANSEEPHRNSPDHNAGTSSTTGVVVVVVKRGREEEEEASAATPEFKSEITVSSPQHQHPPRRSPHATSTAAITTTAAAQKQPKKTVTAEQHQLQNVGSQTTATKTMETVKVVHVCATTTTTTGSTTTTSTALLTGGGAPSQINRRRTPLSQQSGGGGGGGGGAVEVGDDNVLDNVLASQGNNGHPVAPATGDRNFSRACCFCWCCCCSCSRKDARCLTVRNNEENSARTRDANKLEILNGENEPPPTLEDIRAWGESFDRLMRCSAGRKVFRDFLRCEYSEENILFWLACEELKRETNAESVEEKARLIYEDYISILSPKEVSLDSRVREVINRNMVEPSPHTFDEAQLQIYTLMHRDSYPRFVNSPLYKKLAQMNTSSRKESSA